MKGQRIGYIRVSSLDQNSERQLEGTQVDRVLIDKAYGNDTKRTKRDRLLSFVTDGDTVVVNSIGKSAFRIFSAC